MLPTVVGVFVFLLLLLLAVQVSFNLYATSAVTAAAYDGARIAAGFDSASELDARPAAEAHVREVLGEYGRRRLTMVWTEDPTTEILTVRAENPGFLPRALRRPLGLDAIERTVRVRREVETP
jgi:Flp pilus assembly protein TadG